MRVFSGILGALEKLNLARQQALNKLCGSLPMLAATYRNTEPFEGGSGHLRKLRG